MAEMKHYMDIQVLREGSTDYTHANTAAFHIGDMIEITEKFDGSNASIRSINGEVCAFSRKQKLSFDKTLNGFYNFAQSLSDVQVDYLNSHENHIFFGEWSNKNKIVYTDTNKVKHWYVFDIFDAEAHDYLPAAQVTSICNNIGFEHINVLYSGPFISWDHCREFMNEHTYGDTQEGIVVKNQEHNDDSRNPWCIKIINDSFKETNSHKLKQVDPEKQAARELAQTIAEGVVTRARVEKMILKLQSYDELPQELVPADLGKVARVLPKAIYDDCVKEEFEYVRTGGEHFSKACASHTMALAREIILG